PAECCTVMTDSRINWDLEAALAHLSRVDTVMAGLNAQFRPDTSWGSGSRFHSLATAIVSQQLSGKAASTILARVLTTVASGDELTPEGIVAAEHDALRAAGLSNQKARYLRALAEAVLAQELALDELDEL